MLLPVTSNPDFRDEDSSRLGSRVSITTGDGKTETKHVKHPRGCDSFGRVTWDDLTEKWEGELEGCDLEGALRLARSLDTLEDIGQLARRFATTRSQGSRMVAHELHNPTGATEVTRRHARRLASLEGKRIGMVSNGPKPTSMRLTAKVRFDPVGALAADKVIMIGPARA